MVSLEDGSAQKRWRRSKAELSGTGQGSLWFAIIWAARVWVLIMSRVEGPFHSARDILGTGTGSSTSRVA